MPFPRNIKKDFPIFTKHKDLVYLDSAATTQKPRSVIDAVRNFYEQNNANVHRGMYTLSEQATAAYESAREKVANFINAPNARNIIFVRNATEGINLVAHAFPRLSSGQGGGAYLKKGDEVLITLMEHHANIVPWHMLAERHGTRVRFVGVTVGGFLDLADLKRKTTRKTKLTCFTHASNVLGTINPARKLTAYFHKRGIPVLIDGAQAVPHLPVDVQEIGCDFYVFSGHKMLAPTGIGVLYVSDAWLEKLPPFLGGGEMIKAVTTIGATYQPAPLKFEAGTPAIEAAISLGAAIDYLERIGMRQVRNHEIELTRYALEHMQKLAGITIYGPQKAEERTGVIAFSVEGIHPHDLASLLDAEHVCVRAGNHCAMPLHTDVLGVPATTRASFYVYNDKRDTDRAMQALKEITKVLG